MAEFPPRLIKNIAEYDRAAGIIHRLALREGQLDAGEQAYLDVIELLVEQYDCEHHPIDTDLVSPKRGQGDRIVEVVYLVDPDDTLFVIHAMPLTTRRRRG